MVDVCLIADCGSAHLGVRTSYLAARGVRFHAVTPRKGPLENVEQRVPAGSRFRGRWTRALNTGYLILDTLRLVRQCPGEIVHVHYASSLAAWALLVTARREPVVVSVMGGDVLDDEQTPLPAAARWMTTQVLRRADRITAKSSYLIDAMVRRGVAASDVSKVIWGVDPAIFKNVSSESLRAELGLSGCHRVILSPRLLRPFYNINMIVQALPAILAVDPAVRLVILEPVADAAYATELRNLAKELKVDGAVIWAGEISPDRMPAFYSLAHAVVTVPPSEGFPQTVLEAMSCGTPCIVGRHPALGEIIRDGENGVLIEHNPDAIAAAVISILRDAELTERLRRNGPETTRAHAALSESIDTVMAIYDELQRRRFGRPVSWPVRAACICILFGYAVRDVLRGAWSAVSGRKA